MAKILKNNKETKEYLNSLPKAYIAACWAGWGDFNGAADEWHLISIYDTTTGFIAGWSFNEAMLKDYVRLKNIERGEKWRNE